MTKTKAIATIPGTTHLVFVYGTLKRHGAAEAVTNKEYLLYDGGYPLATRADMHNQHYTGKIRGQLLTVDDAELAHMDRYEGHPDFYKRELVSVHSDGLDHEAWMYFGNGALESTPVRAKIVPDTNGELYWR